MSGSPTLAETSTSCAESPSYTRIGFKYVWNAKIAMRQLSDEESGILQISPKFATVHDHVSFQWNLKIHGTTGRLITSDEDIDLDEEGESPTDYVAVELYFVDGPIGQVDVRAVVCIEHDCSDALPKIEQKKSIRMIRGRGAEITDSDRATISQYIKENVGQVIRISVLIKMDLSMFDPFTYFEATPTPQKSFLTTNYNARVNSKVWKRRSRKKLQKESESDKMTKKEKVDYEKKFAEVMESERGKHDSNYLRVSGSCQSVSASRRSSTMTLLDHNAQPDHEHLFKKLLITCCDSCERRRSSFAAYESRTEESEMEEDDGSSSSEGEEEEESFECRENNKEHVHDLLANMYFNKIVLPEMEYVEDFVDFLIDSELNDLPVLKRACGRYLCGELNTKKDLVTSLLLDLLFMSIVFKMPVMKSMTLSELSTRTDELKTPEKLLEDEEYRNVDKRIRALSDRNLPELIEQILVFKEQRSRVTSKLLS